VSPKRKWGPVDRRTVHVWSRVAAHLAAACRLRDRTASAPETADAVLSPSGRLEQAEPCAQDAASRAALTESAKRIDRARGSVRRRDPVEAMELWRALVDGRWSLVDHFDHDGRRFLFARRNEATASRSARLSLKEREVLAHAALGHTNKFIGYQLGLAPSSVAMHLSRCARKLGARSRVELIAMHRRPA
jgi:DNA-binding CsgD family transcriptional regulator